MCVCVCACPCACQFQRSENADKCRWLTREKIKELVTTNEAEIDDIVAHAEANKLSRKGLVG